MRPAVLVAAAVASLSACGGTSPAPVTTVSLATPPPAPTVTAAPAAAAPPAPLPPAVEAPGHQGCLLATREHYQLRLRPDAPPFATLAGASATVDLTTAGPAAGAVLRAVHGGFTLQGLVAADDLAIMPARALVIAGFLVPASHARLGWKAAAPGFVTVTFAPDATVEILPAAGLDAIELPCDAVTLDQQGFDPGTAAPRRPKEQDALLRPGKDVPLARVPDGPPVARIHAADATAVTVLEKRGRRALVRYEDPQEVVFGWIAAADLAPMPTELSGIGASGYGSACDVGLSRIGASRVVRCDRPLSLVAEVAGDRRVVGAIAAGTTVILLEPQRDVVPVLVPDALATDEPPAILGVLASHLGGCEAVRR